MILANAASERVTGIAKIVLSNEIFKLLAAKPTFAEKRDFIVGGSEAVTATAKGQKSQFCHQDFRD